jgi:predicted small lipoprotein YifL
MQPVIARPRPDGETMGTLGSKISVGIVMALAAAMLAGCGVNGPLEPPGGPAAAEAKAAQSAPKAHKPFVLDGLLR